MNVSAQILEYSERMAVCQVTVQTEEGEVTVLGSGLAAESRHFVDLAQGRALHLAHQLLQDGLASVDIAGYLVADPLVGQQETAVSPLPLPTPQPPPPPVAEPEPMPEPAIMPVPPTAVSETEPDAMPEIPW